LGLHRAAIVQYLRPEIPAFILGSFVAALLAGEWKPRSVSVAAMGSLLAAANIPYERIEQGC